MKVQAAKSLPKGSIKTPGLTFPPIIGPYFKLDF